jgi:exopolyphosphatase/guanosine-5'-triphosphate,3'-diphosphate pyrophosphatase
MKAIIDLGTNTFHLLIAEVRNGVINEYFKLQVPVKIGKDGINEGYISEAAFQRGIIALGEFRKYLDRFQVKQVKAFATSAIRSAKNGAAFVDQAYEKFGISVNTISGDAEALFIYEGVRHSYALPAENILVMDIGGGSVEFVIGRQESILWKHSFDLGVARLIEKFHRSEPITHTEIDALNAFLGTQLGPLEEALIKYPAGILVGSAGSFETLADVVLRDLTVIPNALSKYAFEIRKEDFDVFYELMISSDAEQRSRLKGMIEFRVEMIVVAAVLIKCIIEKFRIKKIIASDYSLKEGMLYMD